MFRKRVLLKGSVFGILVLALVATNHFSQSPATTESLEKRVREGYEAWNTGDPEKIIRDAELITAIGFGFRTRNLRPVRTPQEQLQNVRSFITQMEYYRVVLEEVHTSVDGNVGLAWGFHSEDFKIKGHNPEKVSVRFTQTFKYDGIRWRPLLYHRDIQPFDERGAYIPTSVKGE